MSGSKVLVVDDEPEILTIVEHRLVKEGYTVVTAADGEEALEVFDSFNPDIVILDLMLPKLDGFEVCRRLRARSSVPILILSARSDEIDKVVGFRMGVDDYVTKPFSPSELALRVGAVLRRTRAAGRGEAEEVVEVGGLRIDRRRRKVTVNGESVDLTVKEFDLLWFLASNPELVFTREQLLSQVWQSDYPEDRNNVTVLVSRLREKIEDDPSNPRYIKTVWGVGYKFEA